jgi:hypothetical protein
LQAEYRLKEMSDPFHISKCYDRMEKIERRLLKTRRLLQINRFSDHKGHKQGNNADQSNASK